MIAPLRRRNFALLWLGGLVSLVGDQVVLAALPFYIYRLTDSVLQTGTMTIVYFLPSVLLGSVAGVFVDRWNLKRLIVTVNVLQAVGLLPLLLVRSPGTIWIAYLVILAQSILSLFMSPAISAIVPRLVDQSHLSRANALNSTSNNASRLVGPPIGGILLAFAGPAPVVVVDAVSFLAAALLIALLSAELRLAAPAEETLATARSRWAARWSDWARGLALIGRHHLLLGLLLAGGIGSVADGMLGPLIVPFIRDNLHSNAAVYGIIGAATGVGGLCGAALSGWIGTKVSLLRLVGLGLIGVGAVALVRYNIVLLPVALVTFVLGGVGAATWYIARMTALQTETPEGYRGRVFGASGTTASLTLLLGTAVATLLGGPVGVLKLLNASAVMYLAAGAFALLWFRGRAPGAEHRDVQETSGTMMEA